MAARPAFDLFATLPNGLLSPWLEASNSAFETWLAWNTDLWQAYLRGLADWSCQWQESVGALPPAWGLRGTEQLA